MGSLGGGWRGLKKDATTTREIEDRGKEKGGVRGRQTSEEKRERRW
jgi:hypothetical protein